GQRAQHRGAVRLDAATPDEDEARQQAGGGERVQRGVERGEVGDAHPNGTRVAISMVQTSGRYTSAPRKRSRAAGRVSVGASVKASHRKPTPSASTTGKYTPPVRPVTAGVRLTGRSAAA